MKRICLVLAMLLVLSPLALAQDSKEVLTLKRDLVQERVLRVQAELVILKTQFQNGQIQLQAMAKELEGLNASLKALDPKPDPKPKPEKEKKN